MSRGYKSRKFIAFLTWTLIMIALFFASNTPSDTAIQMYGLITALYIGGETAIDAVRENRKEK